VPELERRHPCRPRASCRLSAAVRAAVIPAGGTEPLAGRPPTRLRWSTRPPEPRPAARIPGVAGRAGRR